MYLAIYQFMLYHARLEDIVSYYLNYTLFMLVLIVMVILKTVVAVCNYNSNNSNSRMRQHNSGSSSRSSSGGGNCKYGYQSIAVGNQLIMFRNQI